MNSFFTRFKWYLVLFSAAGAYIYFLNVLLNNAKAKNVVLNNQLINSLAAEAILSSALDDANQSLKLINDQLIERDRLAVKAQKKSKKLNSIINSYHQQLEQLKDENEQFKIWSSQPVPGDIDRLLNNTRNQIQNSNQN